MRDLSRRRAVRMDYGGSQVQHEVSMLYIGRGLILPRLLPPTVIKVRLHKPTLSSFATGIASRVVLNGPNKTRCQITFSATG